MKNVFYIVTVIFLTVIGLTVNAKPRCQGFNNYDNKVTIVFTDNQAKDKYTVSDVKLIPSSWSEKEYPATSVEWKEKQIQSVPIGYINEKDENVFGHACREHVAADESVGTNREGETCR